MFKRVLILTTAILLVSCLTNDQMDECNEMCQANLKDNCMFDPNNPDKSFPNNVECATDVQKRNLCMGYYGCKMGQKGNVTVDYICWNCVLKSPAKSDLYKQYKSCMSLECGDKLDQQDQ